MPTPPAIPTRVAWRVVSSALLIAALLTAAACDKPDEETPQVRAATRPSEADLLLAASQPATNRAPQIEPVGPATQTAAAGNLASLPAPVGDTPGPPVTLPNGLVLQELRLGQGQPIVRGDHVRINYTAWRPDNRVFDSTQNWKTPALTFATDTREVLGKRDASAVVLKGAGPLEGKNLVIPGLAEGIIGMRPGGRRRLTIPAALAFGDKGQPPLVMPNTAVTYEVGLVNLER